MSRPRQPTPDLATYVAGLDRDALCSLLLEAAAEHPALGRRLALAAAEDSGDIGVLRQQVDVVLQTDDFLEYDDAYTYAAGAHDLLAALSQAAQDERAARVVPVVERALSHVVDVLTNADDSIGVIDGLATDLLAIHSTACRRGEPDPALLAEWLVRFSFDEQDLFTIDITDYRSALGKRGLTLYRDEVARRAAADARSFAVQQAAERLAVLDRDADAVVRLFGGDLETPYRFVRVARAMLESRRPDDALAWARRGMEMATTWQSRDLFDLAAAELVRRGDAGEALAVRRRGLESLPDLQSYRALREAAGTAGAWAQERPDALGLLASQAPRAHVEALLDDDDVDGSWAAASTDPRVMADDGLMQRLAPRRASTHPGDVVQLYRRFAEQYLGGGNRSAYRDCARWLAALRTVQERAGTVDDFGAYLATLRELNRRRRAFLDELRRAGL